MHELVESHKEHPCELTPMLLLKKDRKTQAFENHVVYVVYTIILKVVLIQLISLTLIIFTLADNSIQQDIHFELLLQRLFLK